MAIPPEDALRILKSYETKLFENLFAQSEARSVLYEVNEIPDNFPPFSEGLTDRVTLSAYVILSAGVSLAENGQLKEAIAPLKKAAVLLNNTHHHFAIEDEDMGSVFHILIASMAFYASGQYSRAFVAIKDIELKTDLAKIIAAFLRKKPSDIISASNPYLLADLEQFKDYDNLCEHAITVAVSRALSLVLEYLASGDEQYVADAQDTLNIALSITLEYQSPSLWWIVRLLKLMISDNSTSSLWNQLPPYFPNDSALLDKYIRFLLFKEISVMELWHSQCNALPVVLDQSKNGAVINMRTSAGKTRIAELAMLQTLNNNSSAKILYLAPFRSLAFEMEQTLGEIFSCLGFSVSHLYGGFRISAMDKELSQDSNIIIATPEKARAILRGSPELFDNIKLIIVDEGHLIGPDKRDVTNELFLDHLRVIADSLQCKIIMLSAVLPNSNHLATWLTGDANNVAESDWKPSSERFGLLLWQGKQVWIDWLDKVQGKVQAFNPRFVEPKLLEWGRRRKLFPNNKNEAIAATAVRLTSVGPVMIFSARANSIAGFAKSVLMALGQSLHEHQWPDTVWEIFKAICEEELPENAIELKAARYGVICHSNRLPTQVRLATEKLMRSCPPKIVIASKTLGQGVNIGISSVIIASPYYNESPIDHRDFWNICGRAGRAFVDGEGKILYAIDKTEKEWKIRKNYRIAEEYFNRENSNQVDSGLLLVINWIFFIAEKAGVDFSQLLEMIAENDFTNINEKSNDCSSLFDWIDDGLLAFQEDSKINPAQLEPEKWVDDVFRSSLASIQSESKVIEISQDQLLQVIKTRLNALIKETPDSSQRKTYIATGIPLSSAKNVYRDKELFIEKTQLLLDEKCSPQAVIDFLKWLEEWALKNAISFVGELPSPTDMDSIREHWITAIPMREIIPISKNAGHICKDIYGYSIPWLINAVAQLLRLSGAEQNADALEDVAMLVELGMPTKSAAIIFLAGIRSRVAATELSKAGVDLGDTTREVKQKLRDENIINNLRENQSISESTKIWLDLYKEEMSENKKTIVPDFPPLKYTQLGEVNDIIVRSHKDIVYLCSPDGKKRFPVQSTNSLPFDKIANDYRILFHQYNDEFKLFVRDPRIEKTMTNIPPEATP